MQTILKILNKKKRKKAIVEWLVGCAEQQETRWEGSFELNPPEAIIEHFEDVNTEHFASYLDKFQKERLVIALTKYSSTIPSEGDLELVDLLQQDYPRETDAFLLERLVQMDENSIWYAGDYMKRLKHRTSNTHAEELLKSFKNAYFTDLGEYSPEKMKILRQLIDEFIAIVQ